MFDDAARTHGADLVGEVGEEFAADLGRGVGGRGVGGQGADGPRHPNGVFDEAGQLLGAEDQDPPTLRDISGSFFQPTSTTTATIAITTR